MPDREINARQVLRDIRAGMDDAALMAKYKVSPQGLENLYTELANLGLLEPKKREQAPASRGRRIKIKEVVRSVRGGMTQEQLMEKFGLTHEALQMLLTRLVDLKALTPDDILLEKTGRSPMLLGVSIRELDRYELDFELDICDAYRPERCGTVRDLTKEGLGVEGIDAEVGEQMTLLVSPDEFLGLSPIWFEAQCRWRGEDDAGGLPVAGFRITAISSENFDSLQKLLDLLRF